MTTAQRFIRELGLIPRDHRGFFDFRLADGLVARIRHASKWHEQIDRRSFDADERHVFEDGSRLTLANPRQACYPLKVYETL